MDITNFIICVFGMLLTALTVYILPTVNKYLTNSKFSKQFEILKNLAKQAVLYAEEDFFSESGNVKREEALKFAKNELLKLNLTFSDETINAYISSAVAEFIRKSNDK